jgi:beta-lactam-binding protein with PASTA domain
MFLGKSGCILLALLATASVLPALQQPVMEEDVDRATVPDFRGKTLQQVKAEEALARQHKLPFFARIVPDSPDDGVVVSQVPEAKSRMLPDLTLVLTLRVPPAPTIKVPSLLGLTWPVAVETLDKNDLQVGSVQGQKANESIVTGQFPMAGEPATPRQLVNLTLSTPQPMARVPSLLGLTWPAAVQILNDNDLQVGSVDGQRSNQSIVTGQSPMAGQPARPRQQISLTLSTPPSPTMRVPSVLGMTEQDATRILNQSGLQVGDVEGPETSKSFVATQFPGVGAVVAPGAAVNITLEAQTVPPVQTQSGDTGQPSDDQTDSTGQASTTSQTSQGSQTEPPVIPGTHSNSSTSGNVTPAQGSNMSWRNKVLMWLLIGAAAGTIVTVVVSRVIQPKLHGPSPAEYYVKASRAASTTTIAHSPNIRFTVGVRHDVGKARLLIKSEPVIRRKE